MFPKSTISSATFNDIHQLVQLVNSAYRGEVARGGWTHEADLIDGNERVSETLLTTILSEPGNEMLVIKEGDRIIGCVLLENKGSHIYLGMLSVNPTLQAKGVGKKLLQASEEYAIKVSVPLIKMTVISARLELIEWYKRRGYIETGKTEPFPDDADFGQPKQPLHFIVLQKNL